MSRTRTPGITIDAQGCRTLNREHRATRFFVRLGNVSQEEAEERLRDEIHRNDFSHRCLSRQLGDDKEEGIQHVQAGED